MKYLKVFILLLAVFVIALETFLYQKYAQPTGFVKFVGVEPVFSPNENHIAYVSGAVKNPGTYPIEVGKTRISDLIAKAGGVKDKVDKAVLHEQLNLAKLLEDEQHVFIPFEKPISTVIQASSAAQKSNDSATVVNINTASSTELETLDGIGPATAAKIISGRPYSKVEDLLKVSGIGEKTLANIKENVSI